MKNFKNNWNFLVILIGIVFPFVMTGCKEKTYQQCCEEGDYAAAHVILSELHNEYVELIGAGKYSEESKKRESAISAYTNALEYIYTREGSMLLANNDDASATRLIFMLKEISFDGERPSPGIHKSAFGLGDAAQRMQKFLAYKKTSETYNKLLDKFLDLGITQKNKDLAERILEMYEDDYVINQGGGRQYDYNVYVGLYDGYIQITTSSKDAAQMKYDEAVKSGAFD